MRKFWIVIISVFAFMACNSSIKKEGAESAENTGSPFLQKVEVREVIQTSNYTYLNVENKQEKYWIAISKDEINVGDELFYFETNVTSMENFHSKELDRDFDRVLFVSKISKENSGAFQLGHPQTVTAAHSGRKQADPSTDIRVNKAEGGITIAQLYENPQSFSDKNVKISGVVVKVNKQIMGRNWVHIQDGTKFNNEYDLTFTTLDVVELNDVVVIEGKVSIDKDFTSGYFYPVIVEDAKVLN
ncbi:MAG: SH3-like domain-containing protein [Prolixibacteraceae bacterium]|nr:SH3-like domain-containing protein [Prolixibacteraceae bacterium]